MYCARGPALEAAKHGGTYRVKVVAHEISYSFLLQRQLRELVPAQLAGRSHYSLRAESACRRRIVMSAVIADSLRP